ncbi:MAG: glycosyltransferase family A protein [Ignavibacteriaceae bacterium]|nr:glycosyltransferase family A protein [Ignavibacteriaceae bacterium]
MKFSIGMPAFKVKYLNEAISSILTQTYKDYELIVINDCSPDNVEEVVLAFNDKRIKYYKNEKNLGAESIVKSWNKCLEKARGEFFILMADDDRIESKYLEEFNTLMNKYPGLDVYQCRCKIINENSIPIGLSPLCNEYESVYDSIWHRIKGFRTQFISNFVYRTEHLKKEGGFYDVPLAWGSDDISAFVAASKKGVAYTKEPVFSYRKSPLSITSSGNLLKKLEAINDVKLWYTNFLKNEVSDENDKILRESIKDYLPKYIKKKIIESLNNSFSGKPVNTIITAVSHKKEYNINNSDILLGMFFSIQNKLAKYVFKTN